MQVANGGRKGIDSCCRNKFLHALWRAKRFNLFVVIFFFVHIAAAKIMRF